MELPVLYSHTVIDEGSETHVPYVEVDLLPLKPLANNNKTAQWRKEGDENKTSVNRMSREILLVGEYGEVHEGAIRQIQEVLRQNGSRVELTVQLTVQQTVNSTGTLIDLTVDSTRILELVTLGQSNEVRVYYGPVSPSGNASFPLCRIPGVQLADNKIHTLTMTLSARAVHFRMDCQKLAQCPFSPELLNGLQRKDLSLWIGQRHRSENSIPTHETNAEPFKGRLRDVKARIGQTTDGCPSTTAAVQPYRSRPSAELSELIQGATYHRSPIDTVVTPQQYVSRLLDVIKRVRILEDRLDKRCHRSDDSVMKEDQVWINGCSQCQCKNGLAVCSKFDCAEACASGFSMPNECCAPCPVKKPTECRHMNGTYAINQTFLEWSPRGRGLCFHYQCTENGTVMLISTNQRSANCPTLSCAADQQVLEKETCCPICLPTANERCGTSDRCHADAVCSLDLNHNLRCKCKEGFVGNGTQCRDYNECTESANKDLCHANAVCVNTLGGFRCDCKSPGFVHETSKICRDIDECALRTDRCHANGKCLNTEGSYNCQCLPGYKGDGFNCTPICEPECQNGGYCFAPNTCACTGGFFGPECQVDVDECAFGIAGCLDNSLCINIPGSFFCQCLPGFKAVNPNSNRPLCQDVDECSTGAYKCPSSSRCQNIKGSWKCVCEAGKVCDLSCPELKHVSYNNGRGRERCNTCSCQDGVVRCDQPMKCNCNSRLSNYAYEDMCCPQCNTRQDPPSCFDSISNLTYPEGSHWFEDCKSCECLSGQMVCKPYTCPPVQCENPVKSLDISCCPLCPSDLRSFRDGPSLDSCLQSLPHKKPSPIKFGCEAENSEVRSFFDEWSSGFNLCELCDCHQDGRICCAVQNDCPNKLTHAHLSNLPWPRVRRAVS
ncbi:hypothetical protein RvY_08804 [Ramazzottius varieornatus]|uniref:VWFC domain-containing protein n=1 Tax=Ramazzottius varieornatus TaxID=947166 RepID=A0A1D1V777_RAMVA|nr:hypothetical protein RvY_08804 [Ramazzottius varieornatus]